MNNLTPYESYLLNESVDINGPMGFVLSFNLTIQWPGYMTRFTILLKSLMEI